MSTENPGQGPEPQNQQPQGSGMQEWSFAPGNPAENTAIDSSGPTYELAGWGQRVGASLLDSLFLLIPFGVPYGLGLAALYQDSGAGIAVGIPLILLSFVIFAVLYAFLMARQGKNNGQTWGKQIVGIRVVRDDGKPYTFWPAVLREFVVKYLLGGVAMNFCFIGLLDYLWPLWDDQNRAVHDMIVSTHVVKV